MCSLAALDLSQIHSIGPHAALQLIAEIGTDMSRWPIEHHFASWTTLAPNNKISGGVRSAPEPRPPPIEPQLPCAAAL
jgi:transposase